MTEHHRTVDVPPVAYTHPPDAVLGASVTSSEVIDGRCDALIEYVFHGWTGQPEHPRRRPRDVTAFLRCKRTADHAGAHRSEGDIRQWKDGWTSGWIDLPGYD